MIIFLLDFIKKEVRKVIMGKIKSDIEIAQEAKLLDIQDVAKQIDLKEDDLIRYGNDKAKVKISSINRIFSERKKKGKLILVSAITPTAAGEGKTTVSIGLTQALKRIGKNAMVALREPSLGPVFGMKGGAAGGGYSQVVPMEDINLHFTGDMHAISAAHNLISSAIDNHIHYRKERRISIRDITWKRVIDMNDRSLRDIVIGLGGDQNGLPRETGFDIAAASEIMAILCLSTSYSELREKIGNIMLGRSLIDHDPFLVKELGIEGAVTSLLKEALLPNLVQTLENGPAFVHGGPFANIAQGANSIMATKLALHLADYVVTEAGFGSDLGAEKFFNIVCQYGKFCPSMIVLVASTRALKLHGGVKSKHLDKPDPDAISKGSENLEKHIENAKKYGIEVVVAINRFVTDTDEELKVIKDVCDGKGADVSVVEIWEHGGKGGTELAEKVVDKIGDHECSYQPLYDWNDTVENKISKIATEIYGAKDVFFLYGARKDIKAINSFGYDKLPICVAKTQKSLSDDPKLHGRPKDFTLSVREIIISSGAGFLVPLTGEMMRMPGLPKTPAATEIDINDNGEISGLF